MMSFRWIRSSLFVVIAALVVPVLSAVAQEATVAGKPVGFEVATIKPSKGNGGWRLDSTPTGYMGMNVSLRQLIMQAYATFDDKLVTGGPAWVASTKFDLEAKLDADGIAKLKDLSFKERAAMLQPLLADRFKLKVHQETKEFPVFELVVAKGGPKLQETKPEDAQKLGVKDVHDIHCLHSPSRAGYSKLQGCSMDDLAADLRYPTGRTVVDKTGLTGLYNLELPNIGGASSQSEESIYTALQELGLRLEPAKAPLDVLVIDSAEMPSEN